jgi:hypothetical protein
LGANVLFSSLNDGNCVNEAVPSPIESKEEILTANCAVDNIRALLEVILVGSSYSELPKSPATSCEEELLRRDRSQLDRLEVQPIFSRKEPPHDPSIIPLFAQLVAPGCMVGFFSVRVAWQHQLTTGCRRRSIRLAQQRRYRFSVD